jgi:SAM-dependent methyltransferase
MSVCDHCGFVFNSAFDPARLDYGAVYDNTQSCSGAFDTYLDGLVKDLVENKGVRNARVIEVGCGKGHFLRKLVTYPGSGNQGLGFDPSYVGPDTDCDGAVRFYRKNYGADCADCAVDVVICRHVIEHVPDPVALLATVRAALALSPRPRVYFETPCVEWILKHHVIWDFFYEHCSLFSAGSLATAFGRAGFRVEAAKHVFEGQYLWLEAVPDPAKSTRVQPGRVPALAREFGTADAEHIRMWRVRISQLNTDGAVALWGAGAKGVTLANLIDPTRQSIDCVVDVNPNKQGKYLPGTGHPIVDYHQLPGRNVRNVILMNPNYREEITRLLSDAGIAVNLLTWN